MLAILVTGTLSLSLFGPTASKDSYWDLPLDQVRWTDATSEQIEAQLRVLNERAPYAPAGALTERIVLSNGAEGYVVSPRPVDAAPGAPFPPAHLVVHAEQSGDLTGALISSGRDVDPVRLDFVLSSSTARPEAQQAFEEGRREAYRRLLRARVPGGAWFRHRAEEESAAVADPSAVIEWSPRSDLEETFELFSGGRAVAENLQLDRLLPTAPAQTQDEVEQPPTDPVALNTIAGIEVRTFDWTALLEEVDEVPLDALLAWIPADQHVLLTPSFTAFVQLIDELELRASPLVAMMESSSQSVHSRAALEEQLTLGLDAVARLLGPSLIKSVAVTGGDLYLRTGSDVTLLFDCHQPAAVVTFLRQRQAEAAANDPTAVHTNVDGIEGVQTPFRRISSFFRVQGDVVMVSNSRAALQRMDRARSGNSLADLEETRFFRHRYPVGPDGAEPAETACLMISDATIRRWCGPHWRIAASRRLRALAALLEIQAAHVADCVAGIETPRALTIDDARFGDLGQVTLGPRGVHSSVWGSTRFLTPIVEMEIDTVSSEESALYGRWRDGYARNWTAGFDPIAARIAIDDEVIEGDLTVMPLIDNSDYRELRSWSRDARLLPLDGDPHAGSLFHFALAIDPGSPEVLEVQSLLSGFAPGEVANVLGWMSGSVAIFADEDEVWDVVLEAEDLDEALQDLLVEWNDLPLVISVGSNSPLKLAGWMTALRGFAEGSAPGLTHWVTLQDEAGNTYVKVSGDDLFSNDEHLLYATLPEALVLALNEDTLRTTIARYRARRSQPTPEDEGVERASLPEWLGQSAAFTVSRAGLAILASILGESFTEEAQRRTFQNLPILNEWKRLFPDQDPVEVHRRVFGQELFCAGGGEYVWDEEWLTMGSSVLGHPAAPKTAPNLPPALGDLHSLAGGLTFEHDGLRARLRAQRSR